MQRIDENTYIDDTLVTCAEYQLFIDEMREQGKYYQPDHWTSYQLQEGQAREPILGVRFSDAKSFCEWLTQRELSEFHYRIPIQQEVGKYPLSLTARLSLGYWTVGKTNFSWISSISTHSRTVNSPNRIILERSFNRAFKLLYTRALNIDINHDIKTTINIIISRAIDRKIKRTRARALTVALDLALALGFADDLRNAVYSELAGYIDQAINRSSNRALNLESVMDNNLDTDNNLDRTRDLALDLYVDLYTLQERIAGRSPAFEGIRLVKERTR